MNSHSGGKSLSERKIMKLSPLPNRKSRLEKQRNFASSKMVENKSSASCWKIIPFVTMAFIFLKFLTFASLYQKQIQGT